MDIDLQRLFNIVNNNVTQDEQNRKVTPSTIDSVTTRAGSVSLMKILNTGYATNNRIFSVIDGKYFIHASALSTQCFNAILIDRDLEDDYKPTKVVGANTEMVFDIGRKVEDSIRKKILRDGSVNIYGNFLYRGKTLKEHESIKINKDLIPQLKYGEVDLISLQDLVIGHPDFLMVTNDENGNKCFQVLEIKSIGNLEGFKKDDEPKKAHMIQVGSYIRCIQEMYDEGNIPYPPAQTHTVLYCSKKFDFVRSIYKEFILDKSVFLKHYNNALNPYIKNNFCALRKCISKNFENIKGDFNMPCHYAGLCQQRYLQGETKKLQRSIMLKD